MSRAQPTGFLRWSEITGAQSLAVLNHNLVGDSLNHADAQSTSPLRLMPTRALGPLVMPTRALGLLLSLFASAHGLVIPASTLVVPVPTSSIVQSQPVFTTGDLASPYLGTQEQEPSLFPTADVLAANGEMVQASDKSTILLPAPPLTRLVPSPIIRAHPAVRTVQLASQPQTLLFPIACACLE